MVLTWRRKALRAVKKTKAPKKNKNHLMVQPTGTGCGEITKVFDVRQSGTHNREDGKLTPAVFLR